MADRYLTETSGIDGYLLEDGSGVLLLETTNTSAAGVMMLMFSVNLSGLGSGGIFFQDRLN